jgi:hypothetical protein
VAVILSSATTYFKATCLECGREVVARHQPNSDGLVLGWLFEVLKGPEHDARCGHWKKSARDAQ